MEHTEKCNWAGCSNDCPYEIAASTVFFSIVILFFMGLIGLTVYAVLTQGAVR